MKIRQSATSRRWEPKGNETNGFFPLWDPSSSLGSEPTSGNQEDRVPATPPVESGRECQNGARRQGSAAPRQKAARPCPLCAVPAWRRRDGRLRRETIQRQVWVYANLLDAASVG